MATTKAQQKAVHKYVKNNYDRIEIVVTKGKKEDLKQYAKNNGYKSLNDYIIKTVSKDSNIILMNETGEK